MKKMWLLIIMVLLVSGCTQEYTVTFMDQGEVLASTTVKKGDNISKIDTPSKDGYIFVSWSKDGLTYDAKKPITSDITLEANWVEKPSLVKNYTVTFDYGDERKTQTVEEGKLASKPSHDPKREKYTFLGWYSGDTLYDFNEPVTKDILLVAKFEKNRVVITYDLNGGTGVMQVEINKGTIPSKPKNPTKFGYDFIGWSINGENYNFDTPINSDTTIKANYSATVYFKVTFDSDGGTIISSQYLSSGSKITKLDSPEKDGYIFKYWTYNGEEFNKDMTITSDITLVAFYEEIPKEEEPSEEEV